MSVRRSSIVPADLRQELAADLEAGETVLWADRPLARTYARAGWGIFVFGIFFGGFAIVWEVLAIGSSFDGAPRAVGIFFPLFGVPFVLVGLGMLTAPVWMKRRAGKVLYAITDRRAIVREPALMTSTVTVRSFYPERLTSIARTERADGSGDLVFEEFATRHGSGHSTTRRGFMAIADVRGVEELLKQTLAKR